MLEKQSKNIVLLYLITDSIEDLLKEIQERWRTVVLCFFYHTSYQIFKLNVIIVAKSKER